MRPDCASPTMSEKRTVARAYLRHAGVTPLVRPTRSQVEVEYLPPYGDPEVHIPGEVATYLLAGIAAVELASWLGE